MRHHKKTHVETKEDHDDNGSHSSEDSMQKYFSDSHTTAKTSNKEKSSNNMNITPKKLDLQKTQKKNTAGDVNVVIVKKKVG